MEERRRNLLVGVFVLLGLSALASLIVLFGRAPTWLVRGNTYPIHVYFEQVTGVRSGTLVTAKGITIGRVESVSLLSRAGVAPTAAPPRGEGLVSQDSGVDVCLIINREYRLPQGSSAMTTEPVLGQGRPPVEIIPGPADAPPLEAGASIVGTVRRALDSMFPPGVVTTFETAARQIGDAAEALTPVLDETKVLLEQRAPRSVDQPGGPQGNVSSAVARLDASFKHFNEVLGDPEVKSQLRETVANVKEMSEKGRKVMADLETAAADAREVMSDARKFIAKGDAALDNLDGRVTALSQGLMGSLDRADTFLDHLNAIGQQVSSGKGNLGQLVMDGKLYEELVITVERLSAGIEEIRHLIADWQASGMKTRL